MDGTYKDRGQTHPVRWLDWNDRIFDLARKDDRPILVVSGTTWSQRSKQLDEEAFSREEIAALINDRFVPVRIDRDELPDVDAQFQRAIRTIGGEYGWPLVVFLTAERRPFFGGTYYPKDPTPDRPSFKRLLETVATAWTEERGRVEHAAVSLEKTLKQKRKLRKLDVNLVDEGLKAILDRYDAENGGFREKFGKRLWPGALELLLATADRESLAMVEKTLVHMGRGAIFDQIGGGFHHRSHDAMWLAPSFEKLLCDNAETLGVYLRAYEATGRRFFGEIAGSIVDYMFRELCDLDEGGFYASQSADDDYYTWTTVDVMKAVPVDCVKAIGHHFHFRPEVKNVPYRALDARAIAERYSDESEEVIEQRIRMGLEFLRKARLKRKPPFTDRRIFAGWNARASEAFVLAGRILGRKECSEFAEKTRKRIRGQDVLAIFDEVEDYFGPSRVGLCIEKYAGVPIDDLGPQHGSLLLGILTAKTQRRKD